MLKSEKFEYLGFQCEVVQEEDGTYSYSAKDKDDKVLFVGQDFVDVGKAKQTLKQEIETFLRGRDE